MDPAWEVRASSQLVQGPPLRSGQTSVTSPSLSQIISCPHCSEGVQNLLLSYYKSSFFPRFSTGLCGDSPAFLLDS